MASADAVQSGQDDVATPVGSKDVSWASSRSRIECQLKPWLEKIGANPVMAVIVWRSGRLPARTLWCWFWFTLYTTVRDRPIGEGLNGFRDSFLLACSGLRIPCSLEALDQLDNEGDAFCLTKALCSTDMRQVLQGLTLICTVHRCIYTCP